VNTAIHHGPTIEAAEADLATVLAILRAHVPAHEVWAFGSRARRCAKRYSDLDLVIVGLQPLSLDALAALNEAFAESDLPWKVDVVDWARIGDAFRQIIERDKVVLQKVATRRSERPSPSAQPSG